MKDSAAMSMMHSACRSASAKMNSFGMQKDSTIVVSVFACALIALALGIIVSICIAVLLILVVVLMILVLLGKTECPSKMKAVAS